MKTIMTFTFFIIFIVGCENAKQVENYDFKNTGDLLLTETNHAYGYGQISCFNCHVKQNIHTEDRLGTGLLDLARRSVDAQGITSCVTCHGANGN